MVYKVTEGEFIIDVREFIYKRDNKVISRRSINLLPFKEQKLEVIKTQLKIIFNEWLKEIYYKRLTYYEGKDLNYCIDCLAEAYYNFFNRREGEQ